MYVIKFNIVSIGESKEGARDASLGAISLIFVQFLEKIWPNNRLAPPLGCCRPLLLEYLDPPLVSMVIIGGSKGHAPSSGSKFLHFHAVFRKFFTK